MKKNQKQKKKTKKKSARTAATTSRKKKVVKKSRKGIGGAKEKYNSDFPLRAQDFARKGLIDIEIATKLGISEKTYYQYQKKYPQFLQAIKEGKKPVDVEVVNLLLGKARGFDYDEVQRKGVQLKGKKMEVMEVKTTTKKVIPDTAAIIFWLKNRCPQEWRDKQDIALTGKDDGPIEIQMTPEERVGRIKQLMKELKLNDK